MALLAQLTRTRAAPCRQPPSPCRMASASQHAQLAVRVGLLGSASQAVCATLAHNGDQGKLRPAGRRLLHLGSLLGLRIGSWLPIGIWHVLLCRLLACCCSA